MKMCADFSFPFGAQLHYEFVMGLVTGYLVRDQEGGAYSPLPKKGIQKGESRYVAHRGLTGLVVTAEKPFFLNINGDRQFHVSHNGLDLCDRRAILANSLRKVICLL